MAVTTGTEARSGVAGSDAEPRPARLVQPGDRRAGRLGPDDHSRSGAGDRGRRRRRAAVLGAAVACGSRSLLAARGAGAAGSLRRDRRPDLARAGQAATRVVHDGVAPHDRRAALVCRQRSAHPARRADPAPPAHAQAEEEQVRVRADRGRRRDRAMELSVVDSVRRGGDRADGRQRSRAEAGLAHAA